jgi:hypothetical protein
VRDGLVQVVAGGDVMDLGKLHEIMEAGPSAWTP